MSNIAQALNAITVPDRLEAAWLLREAGRISGLPERPDERVHAAVDSMVKVINHMPGAAGRREAALQLLETLVTRLNYLEDRQRYPGINDEQIVRPVIAMGFPRSGTSLLHSLLAADPAARGPVWWEVARPSPPVGLAGMDDPRIAQGERDVWDFIATMPKGVLSAHPQFDEGAQMQMECERLSWLEFMSFSPSAYWKIPTMSWDRAIQADALERHSAHRRLLQHLQYGAPARRWALKGVAHQFSLPELRATYPDAIFIWIHRDPAVCFASGMKLQALITQGIEGRVDPLAIGRQVIERSRAGLDRTLSQTEALNDPQLHHVRYADFVADPVGTIGGIYQRADLPFTAAAEQAMRNVLTDPRYTPNRHGRLQYSLEEFGVTADEVVELFRDYIDRFDIPVERGK